MYYMFAVQVGRAVRSYPLLQSPGSAQPGVSRLGHVAHCTCCDIQLCACGPLHMVWPLVVYMTLGFVYHGCIQSYMFVHIETPPVTEVACGGIDRG